MKTLILLLALFSFTSPATAHEQRVCNSVEIENWFWDEHYNSRLLGFVGAFYGPGVALTNERVDTRVINAMNSADKAIILYANHFSDAFQCVGFIDEDEKGCSSLEKQRRFWLRTYFSMVHHPLFNGALPPEYEEGLIKTAILAADKAVAKRKELRPGAFSCLTR